MYNHYLHSKFYPVVITVTTSGQEIRVIVYLILQFSQFLNVFICSVPIACTTNIYKANTAVNQTNDTNEIFSQKNWREKMAIVTQKSKHLCRKLSIILVFTKSHHF
jgi:hypothetical protein